MIYGFAVSFSDESTIAFPIEASSTEEAWRKLAIELANDIAIGYFTLDDDNRVEAIELQHIGPSKERAL